MHAGFPRSIFIAVLGAVMASCAGFPAQKTEAITGYGPNPTLPKPRPTLIPTVNIAEAKGWQEGGMPTPARGLTVNTFATGLDHPRWLHVLPNGDVLVAETNAPAKHDEGFSLRKVFMDLAMKRAGAATKSANRITLLRDTNGDGVADVRRTFAEGLNSPFGMTLSKGKLYIANTDALVAFPYSNGQTRVTTPPEKITDLPAGDLNHHWTKDVIASPDGRKLYATVGSNSNVGENGMAAEKNRAAVLEVDLSTRRTRVFASGLRNPNGLSWNPETGELWVAVNERDEIGDDLVPDYMTSVRDGAFYGWPYSYYGQNVDKRVKPQRPDLVARAVKPDYALGSHTASLGLTFSKGASLGPAYGNGAFVGQHGSWNRSVHSGYKVIFVPFRGGKPSGPPKDVLTGFIGHDGKAMGRPVGVAIDQTGALLVADDVGNVIWRVSRASRRLAEAVGQ
ncbi:sorbosone dehydrogenase family protein [Mesorhizobium sp. M6A.T.Ca.TU.002.02.2.1]|uniref:PQQ-dependent sugar dehydrogenase n=1 Tax=Mesorhizobium sp. M6A.T.Ce.TU.016.01.1.1 TaxID=2496783 RepID=UPI000FCAA871|nr:sorbosone dehydrogenase family protein [Mesorhizobium sp. M6A.T.Ce.TU.016.01.1.1]RUU25027.1 sorbosone dehydrogenase family protein [Mesorhizobium sp. M6A.T.Ca.TU.002.02.2.1]RUU28062.1 sorbosone dehydrogenase family protein [Mesorhizobium sp. M6A.T.Ce.TU.016.01.1.1]